MTRYPGPTWGDVPRRAAIQSPPPGSGGLNPRPLNAPPAHQPSIGVQPGTSNGVVLAHTVLVFGPAGSVVGVFVYAVGTTPALGNPPVVYITQNTSDPFGNPLTGALIGLQNGSAKLLLADSGGFVSANFYTGTATELLNSSIIAGVLHAGGAAEQQLWQVFGPENTVSSDRAVILLASSPNNAANTAGGILIYGDSAGGQHNLLSWSGGGVARQSLAGMNGGIPLSSMDFFTRTANTTAVTALTTSYAIPANDASVPGGQQTTYRLRAWGSGTESAPADNAAFSISMFGTNVYTSISQAWAQAGHAFTWYMDVNVMISGNSATASFITGGYCIFTDSVALTNVIIAIEGGATVNNTAAGTMLLNWQWGSVVGGPSISCVGSVIMREGV